MNEWRKFVTGETLTPVIIYSDVSDAEDEKTCATTTSNAGARVVCATEPQAGNRCPQVVDLSSAPTWSHKSDTSVKTAGSAAAQTSTASSELCQVTKVFDFNPNVEYVEVYGPFRVFFIVVIDP